MINAMPMMPMDPANAVRNARPFLVRKLLKLNANDVPNDMDTRPMVLCTEAVAVSFWAGSNGSESERITPSLSSTMRVAYR